MNRVALNTVSADGCQEEKTSKNDKEVRPTATVHITLPYVRGISEIIKRMLEKVEVRVRLRMQLYSGSRARTVQRCI